MANAVVRGAIKRSYAWRVEQAWLVNGCDERGVSSEASGTAKLWL